MDTAATLLRMQTPRQPHDVVATAAVANLRGGPKYFRSHRDLPITKTLRPEYTNHLIGLPNRASYDDACRNDKEFFMSRKRRQSIDRSLLAGAFFFAAFVVLVIGGRLASASSSQPVPEADSNFASKAAAGGMAEVEMGQLAADKGTNDAVKAFGQRMVTDHSKAGDKLKDVAAKEGLTLPSEITKADQREYDRLSKLSGKDFDQAYAQAMVKDHVNDVAEFKKEAMSGGDPSLKQFATDTLPTLQDHLKQAKEMARTVAAPAGR
jgi:putative membrane protein